MEKTYDWADLPKSIEQEMLAVLKEIRDLLKNKPQKPFKK